MRSEIVTGRVVYPSKNVKKTVSFAVKQSSTSMKLRTDGRFHIDADVHQHLHQHRRTKAFCHPTRIFFGTSIITRANFFSPARALVFAVSYIFVFTAQCCLFVIPLRQIPGCNALTSSMPSSPRRIVSMERRCNSGTTLPRIHSQPSRLLSRTTTSDEQPPNLHEQRQKPNAFPATTPFNHDIARTLFAPLFFSLHHYQKDEQTSSPVRHHYQRPSPFEDPSCAQTAERMLRRMMENHYRSDGRTVCPDGRTFGLVAAAFGRLRCGSVGKRAESKVGQKTVTWEEEPNVNPHYQGNALPREDAMSIGKIQMTPIDKLQQLLQLQMQFCYREGWPEEIRPSSDMYNRVLKRLAWQSGSVRSQNGDNESAAEKALLWLQLMESTLPKIKGHDEESRICPPDAMSYSYVISALSAYRPPVHTESRKENPSSLMDPPVLSAYKSIDELAKQLNIKFESKRPPIHSSHQWFLSEAEQLLVILESDYNRAADKSHRWGRDDVKQALARGYRYLLEGWGRFAVTVGDDENEGIREHAIKWAHELLCRLESLLSPSNHGGDELGTYSQNDAVPSSCFSSVILALSVSNRPSAAKLAEDVLERMIAQYNISQSSSFFNVAFSGCIAAHAKNNDAPRAEKILHQMLDIYDDGKLGNDFVPEVRAFGTCIAMWSKFSPANVRSSDGKQNRRLKGRSKMDFPSHQQRVQNADRAEAILVELENVSQLEAAKGNSNFVLNAQPYNIAILARVQAIAGNSKYDSDKGENKQTILHAQSILDHMEYEMGVIPDPYTYSILLHAWCQQSRPGYEGEKAAEYAEELLRRRIEDVDIDKIYGDDMIAEKSKEVAQADIWPNVKHYSSVLKAHAKTKSPGGAKKALALLSEMERRFFDANVIDDPNSNHGSTDYHVDQKDVAKPDLVCYSIVIDAFANSRLPEASAVALRLLQAVETKYDAGDVSMKPNTRIYTAAISSLVHSPFIEDEKTGADSDPSGENVNNAQRAWSILERMKANDAIPNSYTYNYIINCASQAGRNTEDKRVSFEIALRAFQELRKASGMNTDPDSCNTGSCDPNSFTFAFMLKACKNLLPLSGSLRVKVMAQTFQECCRSGHLNDAVLDRLWQGVSPEQFYELVKEEPKRHSSVGRKTGLQQTNSPIQANELPTSWSRCCNLSKRRKGRMNNGGTSWKKGVKLSLP